MVLAFISVAMFSNYYVFDALNPVSPILEEQLGFTQAQIGLLDSAYNIAALIVLLAGGIIIDRAGPKRALLLFGVVTALGGALIAAFPAFEGMVAGRFVLGLGAEPLIVAITTALAKWFKGKELSFAMAMNLTIGRLGSVAADNSRNWASGLFSSWQPPLVLAAFVGCLCIVIGFVYWALESRAERRFDLQAAGATDRLRLADLVRFGKTYWWIVGLCVTFYSAVFPFRRFANIFLTDARGVTPETAAFMNGLLPLTAMVATPIFGLLADRIGRRALLMAAGSALMLPAFLILVHTGLPVPVPIAMIGVAFSLIPAVMWPSVAYLVDEKRLGTAYALMTFCQQIGWAFMAWAVGWLNDRFAASAANPGGYGPGMWLFTSLAVFGFVFSYLLWRAERGPGAHGLETITTGAKTSGA
ncbi:MAG: MFS transporter [Acidobacteria bacterium]|nr:MAG: MFS transporter [Acidobacteriota bacterium]